MRSLKDVKFLVTAALLAALTCIATMVIKVPTPTLGYVHPGDGLVLLCGLILGPVYGSLAAGIGSAMADLLSGYVIWAPGTFVIKAFTAMTAAHVYRALKKLLKEKAEYGVIAGCGAAGEALMVFGYFLYNILVISFTNASFDRAGIAAATAESAAEIPFNIVQGVLGIAIAVVLIPVLKMVPDIRRWMVPSSGRMDEKLG